MGEWLTLGVDVRYERTGQVPTTIVGGVLVATSTGTSGTAVSTTLLYVPLGTNLVAGYALADIAYAQFLAPRAFILTSLYFQSTAAPAAGQSFQLKFCVNGVASSEIVATITTGNTTGGATGFLPIAVGDFLCLQAAFTGTATSFSLRSASAGYLMTII